MTYGTPSETGQAEYKLTLQSTQLTGEYGVTITCVATSDNNNHPDVEGIFQRFVDFIGDGGDNFTVTPYGTARTRHYTEYITPTT